MFLRVEENENCICEVCRGITNRIKLEKWKKNNPNIQTSWNDRGESAIKKAQQLRDSGYYKWPHLIQKVLVIEADCHGDSMQLCEVHFSEWHNQTLKDFFDE